MSDLSPELQSLVQASQDAGDPSTADRDRVRRALIAKLGAAALATGTAASISASASASTAASVASSGTTATAVATPTAVAASTSIGASFGAAKLSAVLVLSGVAGVAVVQTRSTPEQHTVHQQQAPARPRTSAQRSTAPQESPVIPAAVAPAPRAQIEAPSTLEAEAALLGRARTALSSGDAERALTLLEQHRTQFPSGHLHLERDAARAISLCTIGHTREGQALADSLVRSNGTSPLVQRAVNRCRQ